MTTNLPVYQAKITGIDTTGIFAMSFVDFPANESNFVALTRTLAPVKLSLDKQKQILTGAVLVPDQMIYRNDNQLGEYYLTFSAPDIEKIRDKMMKSGVALRTTTHQHEKPLRGNHLVECWIVEDPKRDKSVALGLSYPKGTLVASYKVEDAVYWRTQVLTNNVNGFSIEGLFNFKTVKMSKPVVKAGQLPVKKAAGSAIGAVLRSIATMLDGDTAAEAKDLAAVAKADETNSGEPLIVFELQDGTEIDVDSEGFCTMASDGSQAPAGDHTLQDGNTITIGDDGVLVSTSEAGDGTDTPAAAVAALSAQQKAARDAAKAKGKILGAALAKAKADAEAKDPKAKQIAALKSQIAKLEAEPTATPAKPTTDSNATARDAAKMRPHERAALVLKDKLARKNAK
jgi:hypothetical protein